jgi:DeoR family transcriptional regulator of aga operon
VVGPQAERMLQDLHADRLFLGVDGLDPDVGYCTPEILEAQLKALMIRISNEVTVVADASKFGRTQPVTDPPAHQGARFRAH